MKIVGLVIGICVLLGCGFDGHAGKGSTNETTNGVVAYIVDSAGTPISGARVTLQREGSLVCPESTDTLCAGSHDSLIRATTGNEGMVRFGNIPAGQWRLNVQEDNLGLSQAFVCDSQEVDLGHLQLVRLASLEGVLPEGLSGVLVGIPGTELWVTPDAQGHFMIPQAYPGSWLVRVLSSSDAQNYSSGLVLQPGNASVVDDWRPMALGAGSETPWVVWSHSWNGGNSSMLFSTSQMITLPVAWKDLPSGKSTDFSDAILVDGHYQALPWWLSPGCERTDTAYILVQAGPMFDSLSAQFMLVGGAEFVAPVVPTFPAAPWVLVLKSDSIVSQLEWGLKVSMSSRIQGIDSGRAGPALLLPDDSSQLDLTLSTVFQGAFEFGVWMRKSELHAGDTLLHARLSDSLWWSIVVLDTSGGIQVAWKSGRTTDFVSTAPWIAPQKWFHIGMTRQMGMTGIFLNGNRVAQFSVLELSLDSSPQIHVKGPSQLDMLLVGFPNGAESNWPEYYPLESTIPVGVVP